MDNSSMSIEYVESLYEEYKKDAQSVSVQWQAFFKGFDFCRKSQIFELEQKSGSENSQPVHFNDKEIGVVKLLNAYRARGHLKSSNNPVRLRKNRRYDLELDYFGLTEQDLETKFDQLSKELDISSMKLKDIIEHLERTYCSNIGVEYRYIANSDIRSWLYKHMEPQANNPLYSKEEKVDILKDLARSVGFEKFLHSKYVGQKRFSLEGLEASISGINTMINEGAELGVKEFLFGMAHRGRLNVLTNVFQKNFKTIFREFEGGAIDEELGDGDVKYHLGQSADIITKNGKKVHASLLPNPSHLEAVNPVVLGSTKAKWEKLYQKDKSAIVPVLIHGDAAIAGQGIIYEIINMTKLDGYSTFGTIHITFNNQVGFTANYNETRSSTYCTDIAKVLGSPVFHVNADDPVSVSHVMTLAIKLRQIFNIDVYIDILGYRRHGHNESDEPKFTQPALYKSIAKHPTVLDIYKNQLIEQGMISQQEARQIINDFENELEIALEQAKADDSKNLEVDLFKRQWSGFSLPKQKDFEYSIETGVPHSVLQNILEKVSIFPKNLSAPLKKMEKIIFDRKNNFLKGQVDWATAEQLAYGTLLLDKIPIRLSGQDSKRGTFSHRHSVFIAPEDEQQYVFLNNIDDSQAKFQVYNSHLSEYGVLGFEYGYSMAIPEGLTIWEAQFGDFSNGAQIIIDQFISSAQTKWQRSNGLTLFLPHGYEGQGPEHSSARLERFLILAAENNMYVCNITTPANFFHLLRRQVSNAFRIPLIVMTPKSLLRSPKCVSSVEKLTSEKFQEIIDDDSVEAKEVKRVILCGGKIYYDLDEERKKKKLKNVAIVRIEQFYPTPKKQDIALVKKYGNVKQWYWVQEEPKNMGGWYYMRARLDHLIKEFTIVSRKKSASPAHGSYKKETLFQQDIIQKSFVGLKGNLNKD